MRKTKKLSAICLACLTLIISLIFTSCKDKHTHQYTESKVPATCTQEGYNEFTCICGDTYKGNTRLPKTEHTGAVSCNICNLNYFDEIKSLVLEYGTINNMGLYYYRQNNQSTWVCYDPLDMNLSLGLNYTLDGGSYNFVILIPFPTQGNSLQTENYTWTLFLSIGIAMGTINGNTFSPSTNELTLTYYSADLDYIIGVIPSLCARFAKDIINNAFIPLLKLSEKGLSPKNLGFANFSL